MKTPLSLLVSLLVFSVTTQAQQQAAPPNKLTPQALLYSVVKINNVAADIFTAQPQASHGTGFFVGVDPNSKKAVIFTNKHVISKNSLDAQKLIVEFNTDQRRGEMVEAELVYQSVLHDFAVLEVDPSKLKRANLSAPLALPDGRSPFFDFVKNEKLLRGQEVMAIGNPFSGSNVTTYGQITGLNFDMIRGPFIQTQTPINPGNSGGPLISLATGEVIGINTMTMRGADGTHWSIPIGVLMTEYAEWRKQKNDKVYPTIAEPRETRFDMTVIGEDQLKQLGLYTKVSDAIPGFWENYANVMIVTDKGEEAGLENGDILLKLNGDPIGGFPYDLFKRMIRTKDSATMQVLRQGKVMDVEIKVPNNAYHSRRQQVDYVYISGLLLQEMENARPRRIRSDLKSRVYVAGLVQSAEVNFSGHGFPPQGSIIVSVNFGGKEYPVDSLFDIKKALHENRDKPFIVVHAYRSNVVQTKDGRVVELRSQNTGQTLIDGVKDMFVLPMKDVITPFQFSMHKFIEQFQFKAEGAGTRDWRAFVKPDRIPSFQGCQQALETPKPE